MAIQQIQQGEQVFIPNPSTPAFRVMIRRDVKKGLTAIYYSEDAGATWKAMLPAPTSNNQVGSVLTLGLDGVASWQVPPFTKASQIPMAVQLTLQGTMSLGQSFGYLRIPDGLNLQLTEIQASLQDVSDGRIVLDVSTLLGVAQNRMIQINPGSQSGLAVLSTPLSMPSGSEWTMKVLQCGSLLLPGAGLSVRLVLTSI